MYFQRQLRDWFRVVLPHEGVVIGFVVLYLLTDVLQLLVALANPWVAQNGLSWENEMGVGVAITAAVLFATGFMVTFTIVGAPLGMTTLFVLGVGLYVAQVYVAAYIGREIMGTPTSASAGLARLALGLFLVHVAKSIPFVSFIAGVLIALWGFGALAGYVRARFQTTEASIPAPEVPA